MGAFSADYVRANVRSCYYELIRYQFSTKTEQVKNMKDYVGLERSAALYITSEWKIY